MADILNALGEDLALLVRQRNLPTAELDVDKPKVAGYRFFPMLLGCLNSAMNSVFLVGDDLAYINAYINSLAVLMSQPDDFAKVIRAHKDQLNDETVPDRAERVIERLVGKQLRTLHVEKLMSFSGKGTAVWDAVFDALIEETHDKGYFLVIDNIHEIYGRDHVDQYDSHPSNYLYFATRGKVRLTFIAPLVWPNYVNYLEGPPMTLHRTPFFFSPRPVVDLPYSPITKFDGPPDATFDFSDK